MLNSQQFSGAERRKKLLEYLVEETLAGRGADLKEYRIGVDVYGRDASTYDPRIDPVVRVDIGRLRTKLSEYYSASGRHAPLRLELPKGSYSVLFEANGAEEQEQPALSASNNAGNGHAAAIVEEAPETPDPGHPRATHRAWRAAWLLTAALLLSVVGARVYWLRHTTPHPPHSLAVIPFASLAPDHANDYFSDGLADEVTATLGRIRGLRVIARASTLRFRNDKEAPQEIGRQLGVETVLSGSVQRSGDHVRVIAQLNSTADGSQIWSEVFDGDGLDALGLEDRVASSVASEFGTPPPRGYVSKDPAVHDLYLRGRFFATQHTPAAVLRAIELFHQALDRDPNDPECLRGLAAAEVFLASVGQKPPEEANREARPLIERAVASDPSDGMGHLMLGYMLWVDDRNWRGAESEFRKAVELSPNSPDVRNNYGYMLMYRGRFDEAQVQFIRGREIDPLSVMPHYNMCGLYYYMRDYPHAEAECRTVLRMNPKNLISLVLLADILSREEKYADAFQELDRARALMIGPDMALAYQATFLARQGKREDARRVLRQLEAGSGAVDLVARARAYLECGDREKALEYLDRAYREHDGIVYTVPFDPAWAGARSDPRFENLFRRILGD